MSLKLNSSGGGSVTLQEPSTASNLTLTLPAVTATVLTDSSGVLNIGSGQVYKDASGNVGIGTSSPSTYGKVAVQLTGTTTPTNASNVNQASIALYNATNGGSTDGTVGIFGWNSSDPGIGSGIGFSRESSSNWGTQIRFYTHPTSTTNISDLTERARIDSSGNLLVGTTSLVGSSGSCFTGAFSGSGLRRGLTLNDTDATSASQTQIAFFRNSSNTGTITCTNTATAYNTSSDYRLKDNIAPMTGALAKVAALKPCTYTWKADGSDGEGFIAHELAEVVPQCVTGEKDAVDADGNPVYQGIDTSFLVATLTAAIQEQQSMIEELKAKVAALEAK